MAFGPPPEAHVPISTRDGIEVKASVLFLTIFTHDQLKTKLVKMIWCVRARPRI